ncbi:MAG: DNA-formamidopyrimidine glycosylase [Chloroflexota bacterium]
MPELPEVETYRRELAPELVGRTIEKAEVLWPRIIAEPSPGEFCQKAKKQEFDRFDRRGKYLIFSFIGGSSLIIHLRMTGEIHIHPPSVEPDKHTHVRFWLDDGRTLHYRDMRKFGRLWLVDNPGSVLFHLGPEPLDDSFTPERLATQLARRKSKIKSLLLDQSVVAGVGNIYADEALFRAGIDPRRLGNSLSIVEVTALHGEIRNVLQWGIEKGGSTLQNYVRLGGLKGEFQHEHQVFRKTGQPCPKCGHPIERTVITQRSTHFCSHCQT